MGHEMLLRCISMLRARTAKCANQNMQNTHLIDILDPQGRLINQCGPTEMPAGNLPGSRTTQCGSMQVYCPLLEIVFRSALYDLCDWMHGAARRDNPLCE